ncbi:hypothetical protein HNY73_017841 [Argiope bruennichi]|uniref:Uncharacterized protein n=1 Tax=Argiope bruennichi TaxID=94029 RepID=A0A8T0EB20_ARGBR|nr:hypothetical protein HNY73_017841 [Argiope bruennichi]
MNNNFLFVKDPRCRHVAIASGETHTQPPRRLEMKRRIAQEPRTSLRNGRIYDSRLPVRKEAKPLVSRRTRQCTGAERERRERSSSFLSRMTMGFNGGTFKRQCVADGGVSYFGKKVTVSR